MVTKSREDLSDRVTFTQSGAEVRLTQTTIADVAQKMVDRYLCIDASDSMSTGDYIVLRQVYGALNALRNYYGSDPERRDGLVETIAREVTKYLPTYTHENPLALFKYTVEARMKKGFRNSSRLILLFAGVAAAEFLISAGNAIHGNKEEAINYLIHGTEMLTFGFMVLGLRSLLSPTRESVQYQVAADDMKAVLDDHASTLQEKLARQAYVPA